MTPSPSGICLSDTRGIAASVRLELHWLGWRKLRARPAEGLEERFLPFLDAHRLPRPHLNVWLEVGRPALQGRLPLAPHQRQIVELDGWQAHGTRIGLPRRPRPRPPPARRRLQRHPPHLVPARRRTRAAVAADLRNLLDLNVQTSVITYTPMSTAEPPIHAHPAEPAARRRPPHPARCATRWASRCATSPSARGQRADALAGRARGDQPDAGGRRARSPPGSS